MLSQSLPNACNSNLKGSLRPRFSFHWSFLSLHSKFMCRVELQGSLKPLTWFAEQPEELECRRCLNGLRTWLSRREQGLWTAPTAACRLHSSVAVPIVACRLPPGRWLPLHQSLCCLKYQFQTLASAGYSNQRLHLLGRYSLFISVLSSKQVILLN